MKIELRSRKRQSLDAKPPDIQVYGNGKKIGTLYAVNKAIDPNDPPHYDWDSKLMNHCGVSWSGVSLAEYPCLLDFIGDHSDLDKIKHFIESRMALQERK